MARTFSENFPQWMQDFYSMMNNSAEMRADIHELIIELEAERELSDQQAKLVHGVLTQYVSLYHICNRSPEKLNGMIQFMKPEDNGRL
ncbi:hypothetical protein [Epilithonimonas hominis]|uniref:hypothetical protein n=1 Tax=Epilithonimonas hominis TaxID=420404 RepID=UPI00289F60FF|nr:hypothetical protein [Epilithonimonas hominis]